MIRVGIGKALFWWIPLSLLGTSSLLLVGVEQKLQDQIDRALATERIHMGRARSVREAAQESYVAMLERWIQPASEKAAGTRKVNRDLAMLRESEDAFASLVPLSPVEAEARSALIVAVALFANRVQKALINEDGPAAIAEISEYTAAINRETQLVLTVDSAAGHVNDEQVLLLRRQSRWAIAGLVVAGLGALVHAFFWWAQKRKAVRRFNESERARREQEHNAAVRARFFALMSHELRTPIVVIQNLAGQIQDPAQTQVASRIRQAADELLHGINNVLDSSKLESGAVQMRIESVDLEDVIRRSVHRCEGLIGTKAIELQVRVEPELPLVLGDIVKLHQVFTNLVANAIKFTEAGHVTVTATRQGDTQIRVEVRDSGIGISEQALARIWQPFEQADDGISRRFGGTGLGLSLVKTLVELHKGQVGVSSQLGEGACFWVTLGTVHPALAA